MLGIDSSLWGITAFFNPCGYQSRLANYRVFRKHLSIPLVTVELSDRGGFELREGDADVLIQIESGDVMWQKERLLNVALQQVPDTCRHIAWLDADIIFPDSDWPVRAVERLDKHDFVQLFHKAYDLPPGFDFDRDELSGEEAGVSVVSALRDLGQSTLYGEEAYQQHCRAYGVRKGLAWAARAELLRTHSLYDTFIIGSGDNAVISTLIGEFDGPVVCQYLNSAWASHYLRWAHKLHDDVRGNVGFLDQPLFHLWHGAVENRATRDRHVHFERFDFDPERDIALTEEGSWRWSSDKPEMHSYVRNYFSGRREDDGQLQAESA